ncbi:MAG: PLP-dependent lyase/thiolase, partial [Clostridiaceae bacterium]
QNIILPAHAGLIKIKDLDLDRLRSSLIKNQTIAKDIRSITPEDLEYLILETKSTEEFVGTVLGQLDVTVQKGNNQ